MLNESKEMWQQNEKGDPELDPTWEKLPPLLLAQQTLGTPTDEENETWNTYVKTWDQSTDNLFFKSPSIILSPNNFKFYF